MADGVSEKATVTVEGEVAVIECNNPPVNAISHGVRSALLRSLERALADDRVGAIIIACRGAAFFAGADITEFQGEEAEPTADQLFHAIESARKPIVAAMHRRALGGGLELALTCHYRVATPDTEFGFPEVKLGLIPGLGGTQRSVRLVGLAEALKFVPAGDNISAQKAKSIGLIDVIANRESLLPETIAFVTDRLVEIRGKRISLPRARDSGGKGQRQDLDLISLLQTQRELLHRKFRGRSAPLRCVEAMEAGLTRSFDDALAEERRIFNECLTSREAESLTYLFFAEREARKIAGIGRDVQPSPINAIGVVGGGTMGRGITISLLEAGKRVVAMEQDSIRLAAWRENLEAYAAKSVTRGMKSQEQAKEWLSRCSFTLDWNAFATCDLVIEAVFEDLELKKIAFSKLSRVVRSDCLLASNTSGLDINLLAAAIDHPEAVIGLHFFSPAHVMKLLEVVRGKASRPEALVAALQLARDLNKVAVISGVCEGFIGNRIFDQYWREAEFLVEEGASPYLVDKALQDFGMAMGPFKVSDLAGLDIGHAIRTRQQAAQERDTRFPAAEEAIYQAGRLGQKSAAGWYKYIDGRAIEDPAVAVIIGQHRTSLGRKPNDTDIKAEEIVLRCMSAIINEACKVLDEGIAQRASDVDLVAVHGFGFPAWLGGPMKWADHFGLSTIYHHLVDRSGISPELTSVASLLEVCAKGDLPLSSQSSGSSNNYEMTNV